VLETTSTTPPPASPVPQSEQAEVADAPNDATSSISQDPDPPLPALRPATPAAEPVPPPAPAPQVQAQPVLPPAPMPQPPAQVAAVAPPAAVPPAPPKPKFAPGTVTVDLAWAREADEGVTSTSAFMVINYEGSQPDRLVSASSPDAQTVTIQQARGDTSQVIPVRNIEFEPGIPVVFEPTGYHLVLDGLKHPLGAGRKVTIFLILEKTGTVQVAVPVGEPQHPGQSGGSE